MAAVEFMGPRVSKAIGSKICVLANHEYLSSLRAAASSAAEVSYYYYYCYYSFILQKPYTKYYTLYTDKLEHGTVKNIQVHTGKH